MRVFIINSDYRLFTDDLYFRNPRLHERTFKEQLQVRNEALFATSDFYPQRLGESGVVADEFHYSTVPMQLAWVKENLDRRNALIFSAGFRACKSAPARLKRACERRLCLKILRHQIIGCRPDVILNHCPGEIVPHFFSLFRNSYGALVAQHAAAPLPAHWDYRIYDAVISSFEPTIQWFQSRDITATLIPLGFEERVLQRLSRNPDKQGVSFIGSLQAIHGDRIALLERLAEYVPIQIWTPDAHRVPSSSPLRRFLRGPVWGIDMYRQLQQSRVTINHHGSIPAFANNLRLYEATGVGTTLVTDWKPNLKDMFALDQEVLAYKSVEECVEKVRWASRNPNDADEIGKQGQHRTLATHQWKHVMPLYAEVMRDALFRQRRRSACSV